MTVKVILSADAADDLVLALRATQWLRKQPDTQRDAIVVYGGEGSKQAFYVRRGKNSLIARPCY